MDYVAFIDQHLIHWGIFDKAVRKNFLKEVVENRSETRAGITSRKLNELIEKHGLKGVLTVDNVSILRPIKRDFVASLTSSSASSDA